MTTLLEDHGTHWVVKTIDGGGKRRRMGRYAVRVGKSDPEAVRAEMVKQAEVARAKVGLLQAGQVPVV